MSKILVAVGLLFGLCSSGHADPYADFRANVAESALKPFAKDFGGLIGASDFHSAKVPKLGGFDIGVSATIQSKPTAENIALTNAGVKAFGIPLVRVEVGLPMGFSVFARGISATGASLFGGGARYQVYKSGLLIAVPDVAVTIGYDALSHDVLKLTHLGFSAQASWNIPIIKPFVGLGFDSTTVEVKQALTTALVGISAKGTGVRITAGASLTLIPFTYLYGAYSMLHGQTAVSLGLGVRFGGIL